MVPVPMMLTCAMTVLLSEFVVATTVMMHQRSCRDNYFCGACDRGHSVARPAAAARVDPSPGRARATARHAGRAAAPRRRGDRGRVPGACDALGGARPG